VPHTILVQLLPVAFPGTSLMNGNVKYCVYPFFFLLFSGNFNVSRHLESSLWMTDHVTMKRTFQIAGMLPIFLPQGRTIHPPPPLLHACNAKYQHFLAKRVILDASYFIARHLTHLLSLPFRNSHPHFFSDGSPPPIFNLLGGLISDSFPNQRALPLRARLQFF